MPESMLVVHILHLGCFGALAALNMKLIASLGPCAMLRVEKLACFRAIAELPLPARGAAALQAEGTLRYCHVSGLHWA